MMFEDTGTAHNIYTYLHNTASRAPYPWDQQQGPITSHQAMQDRLNHHHGATTTRTKRCERCLAEGTKAITQFYRLHPWVVIRGCQIRHKTRPLQGRNWC